MKINEATNSGVEVVLTNGESVKLSDDEVLKGGHEVVRLLVKRLDAAGLDPELAEPVAEAAAEDDANETRAQRRARKAAGQ